MITILAICLGLSLALNIIYFVSVEGKIIYRLLDHDMKKHDLPAKEIFCIYSDHDIMTGKHFFVLETTKKVKYKFRSLTKILHA